jgi:hypothetical protein
MSLTQRIKDSTLSQQAKLALGIISSESMTARELTECLICEPYELTSKEVFRALTELQKRGLLEIKDFVTSRSNSLHVEARLMFAHDWVVKL